MNPLCRAAVMALFLGLVDSRTLIAQNASEGSDNRADWSRITPGDVHFYAEMKDLAGVRTLFQSLGVWEVVRDLSGQEPRGATTQPWHRKAEEFLGMDADKAIDDIVGRRCALIATEPPEWHSCRTSFLHCPPGHPLPKAKAHKQHARN